MWPKQRDFILRSSERLELSKRRLELLGQSHEIRQNKEVGICGHYGKSDIHSPDDRREILSSLWRDSEAYGGSSET